MNKRKIIRRPSRMWFVAPAGVTAGLFAAAVRFAYLGNWADELIAMLGVEIWVLVTLLSVYVYNQRKAERRRAEEACAAGDAIYERNWGAS